MRLASFYRLTRTAHPQKNRAAALWFAFVILRRVRRVER